MAARRRILTSRSSNCSRISSKIVFPASTGSSAEEEKLQKNWKSTCLWFELIQNRCFTSEWTISEISRAVYGVPPSLRTPCTCYGLPVPMDSPCLNFSECIAHSLIPKTVHHNLYCKEQFEQTTIYHVGKRAMISSVMHSQGSQMLLERQTCWSTGDIWIWSGLGWSPGNHREEFDLRGHSTVVSTSSIYIQFTFAESGQDGHWPANQISNTWRSTTLHILCFMTRHKP